MHPQNLIRALVSTPKKAYYDAENFLDLSYISPRLIVAAGPTDNFLSTIYRSPVNEIVSHLNRYKSGAQKHWHMWNLRGEGSGYSVDSCLEENWTYHPFPDHSPPSLTLLHTIVQEIDVFLRASPKHVALVHCKEGKGRSGTICCAYLMYEAKVRGVYMSVEEAIAIFTRRRMRKFCGQGVSISSQIKYLEYWKRFLQLPDINMKNFFDFHSKQSDLMFNAEKSVITGIKVIRPSSMLILSKLKLFTYIEKGNGIETEQIFAKSLGFPNISATSSCLDISVKLPITSKLKDLKIAFERQICLACTWFNLYFESLGPNDESFCKNKEHPFLAKRLVIAWEDFDGIRGTRLSSGVRLFDKIEVQWVFHF